MPRSPSPHLALLMRPVTVTGTCAECGEPFTWLRISAGPPRRYCDLHRRAKLKPAAAEPLGARSGPPDWSRAYCVNPPRGARGFWTSTVRAEQDAARFMCQRCPVLEQCAAWSATQTVDGIYAGLDRAQRARLRQASA